MRQIRWALLFLIAAAFAQQQETYCNGAKETLCSTNASTSGSIGGSGRVFGGKTIANFRALLTSYNRTSAEIAAGVTPINLGYAPLNVLRYGADPSGAESSSTAFQDAGLVAHAMGGGTITVPCGTYLASNVSYAYGGVYLEGSGKNCVTIEDSAANTPIFNWGNGINLYYNGGVSGITFAGAPGVTGARGQMALQFQKMGQFFIRDVLVTNFPAALNRGIVFTDASQFAVYDAQIQGALSDGVQFHSTTDAYITDSRSDSNGGNGWLFDATQGDYFMGDTAYDNVAEAYKFTSAAPATAVNKNVFFNQVIGDTSGSYNWQINDCENCYFQNVWGSTQRSTKVNTGATGFLISSKYSQGIFFIGGVANNNNSSGVEIYSSGRSAPRNITFVGFQFGSTANAPDGNGKACGGGYGLEIVGTASHIIVSNSSFEGNAGGALLNSSSATNISLWGNIGYASPVPVGGKYTVSTLPKCTAHNEGKEAYVTDARSPTYGSTLVGGGSRVVPAFCDGTRWTAH